jgi:hypothetical protein
MQLQLGVLKAKKLEEAMSVSAVPKCNVMANKPLRCLMVSYFSMLEDIWGVST